MKEPIDFYSYNLKDTEVITFEFPGRVIPKQRPRSKGKHHYLPPNYANWKDQNVKRIKLQWELHHMDSDPPKITFCFIQFEMHGKFLGDADNIIGSMLDVLVQSGVLYDDKVDYVGNINIRYFPKSTVRNGVAKLSKISYYYNTYNHPYYVSDNPPEDYFNWID